MAIENRKRPEITERMSMGIPVPGKKVIYEPEPLKTDVPRRRRTAASIDLTHGAIFSHPYSSIGKKVLYDPDTDTILS